ncbi:uncharacterized protein [Pocillopora verrucosa]|uniref:uncharacterized protein n=1 Tax=Pocillopora verrucosa TaxID=203993 RepID=UPI00333FA641
MCHAHKGLWVARKFKDTKFPLVISLLFVLIAFPTIDSKPAKWVPLNEEVSGNFCSVEAHDEFRPPIGKRIADINFNTVDDLNYKLPVSTSTLWKTKIIILPPGKRSAGINFHTVEDRDKFLSSAGKRSAGIIFSTVKDQDKFLPPAGKRSAGVNFNTVEDQDKFLPPAGKRSAGIIFNTNTASITNILRNALLNL